MSDGTSSENLGKITITNQGDSTSIEMANVDGRFFINGINNVMRSMAGNLEVDDCDFFKMITESIGRAYGLNVTFKELEENEED